MTKEWQTFVRKFEDLREGEAELFIKDLTPGPRKYDTKHVEAKISKSKAAGSDLLWIRSESGSVAPEPWYINIHKELPAWIPGRPWGDIFEAIKRAQKEKSQ